MNGINLNIDSDDILALIKVIDLIEEFIGKNIIKKYKINFNKLRKKANHLKSLNIEENETKINLYHSILKKINLLVKREHRIDIFFITGAHGGVIVYNSTF